MFNLDIHLPSVLIPAISCPLFVIKRVIRSKKNKQQQFSHNHVIIRGYTLLYLQLLVVNRKIKKPLFCNHRDATQSLGFEPLIDEKTESEAVSLLAPTGDYNPNEPTVITIAEDETVKITVLGMTCQSCVRSIEDNLSRKPGVYSIKVSLQEKAALVHYDTRQLTPAQICDFIDDMGFEAALAAPGGGASRECRIHIEGMTCKSCVQSIEGVLT